MFKKIIPAVAVATLALAQNAFAQTNLQTFYDFGKDRGHFTTTLEGFYGDSWGNTFFFIDYDYNSKNADGKVFAPSGTYFEIARCLNFWQDSKLAPFSLHIEYNGGVYNGYTINNAFLTGIDYFLHSDDFKNTFNLKLLGKFINYNGAKDADGNLRKSIVPLQFTFVWGMQDIFGVEGLRFSGFADFWAESHNVITGYDNLGLPIWEDRSFVFISEPQVWYNVGKFINVPNLNVGCEVELSYDFATSAGFYARPCLGTKWVF